MAFPHYHGSNFRERFHLSSGSCCLVPASPKPRSFEPPSEIPWFSFQLTATCFGFLPNACNESCSPSTKLTHPSARGAPPSSWTPAGAVTRPTEPHFTLPT
ncbi:hypothetical protein CRENBAI_002846 [Crenichthys baileyi]|uniref:Uncharacterized protein n=1 Tax=Crenichthys baileyi TaxID=28760 RepID=A0AAV9SJN8_9TELE